MSNRRRMVSTPRERLRLPTGRFSVVLHSVNPKTPVGLYHTDDEDGAHYVFRKQVDRLARRPVGKQRVSLYEHTDPQATMVYVRTFDEMFMGRPYVYACYFDGGTLLRRLETWHVDHPALNAAMVEDIWRSTAYNTPSTCRLAERDEFPQVIRKPFSP